MSPPDNGEEQARAGLYGLLANLFYAPPGPDLLADLHQAASAGEGPLPQAWAALVSAAGDSSPGQIAGEYESLFIGTGKPEVMLFGSYYLSGFLMEKPLVRLRDDLQELGLERSATMSESEDHIAALFEVMQYLIASDDFLLNSLEIQKRFFSIHIQPWFASLCDAISAHPQADFYGRVAELTKLFLEIEAQAMDMS